MSALARWTSLAACAVVAACASWPVVRSERHVSPDATLEMVVIVREAPDKNREATHEVFVDIARPGENKGRYLHEEYRYLLKGSLDCRVVWSSSDMVTLHILERAIDRPSATRDVAVLVFVRDGSGIFHQLQTGEETRQEVA